MKKLLLILLLIVGCDNSTQPESQDCAGVEDIDGNCYETVQIGAQEWLTKNLQTTHYQNGDAISTGYSSEELITLETEAYTVYPINYSFQAQTTCDYDCSDIYGNLYNWYSANDIRGICPENFHVPSDNEWIELEMYLGMSEEVANNKFRRGTYEGAKLAGNAELWILIISAIAHPLYFSTSGFNAIPAGKHWNYGYMYIGDKAIFWSSSEFDNLTAWRRGLYNAFANIERTHPTKKDFYSIRCLKD